MTVRDLWTHTVNECFDTVPMQQWSLEEGFASNQRSERAARLGIDASQWMYQLCANNTDDGENPELGGLYARCVRLLKVPVVPMFVFDGEDRPSVKRGIAISKKDHWLTPKFKDLLQHFGFTWTQAPADAETQLAWMADAGLVDAVNTDDADVLTAGEPTILRFVPNTQYTKVRVYSAAAIQAHGWRRADFILMALLIGGDYDVTGLRGCGVNIASDLARAGLGRQLINGLDIIGYADCVAVRSFLACWRGRLITELRHNPSGCLRRAQPLLANHVPDDFPSLSTIRSYRHPITTSNMDEFMNATTLNKQLDIGGLAAFASQHFTWGKSPRDLLARFARDIFPGHVLHTLLCCAVALDKNKTTRPARFPLIKDVTTYTRSVTTGYLTEAIVTLRLPPALVKEVHMACIQRGPCPAMDSCLASIPLQILDYVLPDLVATTLSSREWFVTDDGDEWYQVPSPYVNNPRPSTPISVKVSKSIDGHEVVEILDSEDEVVEILDSEDEVVEILDSEDEVVEILDGKHEVIEISDSDEDM